MCEHLVSTISEGCPYRCGGEGFLQHVENRVAFVGEVPSRVFAGEVGEQNGNVGVVQDEMPVEISETNPGKTVYLSSFEVQANPE